MNSKERQHLSNLKRRRDLLVLRVAEYRKDGDPNRAKSELSALNWAIRIIESCESHGILKDVSS